MAERYTVKITRPVERQMTEIVDYISNRLQNPVAASRLLDELERQISSLSRMPYQVMLTEEEPWHSRGIHRLSVREYLVYFWIDEPEKKVQVTAVVYGRRDQREQLANMEME